MDPNALTDPAPCEPPPRPTAHRRCLRGVCMCLFMFLVVLTAAARSDGRNRFLSYSGNEGLSVFIDASAFWADDYSSGFYSGIDGNANTIYRVLHSQRDGTDIWYHLKSNGLIDASIGTCDDLTVEEFPSMYYRSAFMIGLGLHYTYRNGFGWLLRFDIAKMEAAGAFNLANNKSTTVLNQNHYIRCGMLGEEQRIYIDLAITKEVDISPWLNLEVDLGLNVNNTKVSTNAMEIAGRTWSILDVWDGQSPYVGIGEYEYVNQGGLGYGVFMAAYLGYRVEGLGAVKLGYSCHHTRTNLKGYEAMGWHHQLALRFEVNNFSFFS